MTIIYETIFFRRCPADGAKIRYQFRAEAEGMLLVESILAAIKGLPASGYQEVLTAQLRKEIKCTRIITVGRHSGIKVTCTT